MVEILSRVQFAFTIAFHFIFVPLTVGLILMIVVFEFKHYRTKDGRYAKLSNYFSDIFLINYAFGIVTGIAMTVQFGTNWGNFSVWMGDIFGSPLLIEAVLAFFLESTFTGLWLFRRYKMTPKMRLLTVSLIAFGTTLSAIWIITANGFMHNPVGAYWSDELGKMVLTDFGKVLTNPYTWYMFFHNHLSAIILSGFVMLAVSSWHLLYGKSEDKDIFKISAKFGVWAVFIGGILIAITGSQYLNFLNLVQPDKVDMINAVTTGGLKTVVRIAFGVMVTLGFTFIAFSLYTVIFFDKYTKSPTLQRWFLYLVPFPYIAIIAGWMVTEFGRQPWLIYGIKKTPGGVSDVPVNQIWFSLISLVTFYAIMFIMDYVLTMSRIKKGIDHKEVGESNDA
jgi:cytochrome d ubiquinol oxidase subunit I